MSIQLYYYNIGNFGDSLSYRLCVTIANKQIIESKPYNSNLFAVGSILLDGGCLGCQIEMNVRGLSRCFRAFYQRVTCPPLHIWRSGFLRVHKIQGALFLRRRLIVHALRGEKTLAFF